MQDGWIPPAEVIVAPFEAVTVAVTVTPAAGTKLPEPSFFMHGDREDVRRVRPRWSGSAA